MQSLTITSPAFQDGGKIPVRHTGDGEDLSPELHITGLPEDAVSLCVMMDDLDIPLLPAYNHWVLWNLPVGETVPEGIPHGPRVEVLGASQGVGYGKHRYRGPKPPLRSMTHRYLFVVCALDCALDLPANTRKKALLRAIDGHVLASGGITGLYY